MSFIEPRNGGQKNSVCPASRWESESATNLAPVRTGCPRGLQSSAFVSSVFISSALFRPAIRARPPPRFITPHQHVVQPVVVPHQQSRVDRPPAAKIRGSCASRIRAAFIRPPASAATRLMPYPALQWLHIGLAFGADQYLKISPMLEQCVLDMRSSVFVHISRYKSAKGRLPCRMFNKRLSQEYPGSSSPKATPRP